MENYENANKMCIPSQLPDKLENKTIKEEINLNNLEPTFVSSMLTSDISKTPTIYHTKENQLHSLYDSFVNKNSIQINKFNENK